MQDVIGDIVACDPTGHASSAWTVISLGLKMTQNDRALQDTLFEASEFLTSLLARYTLVEKLFGKLNGQTRETIETSVIKLYASIMRYALEMTHVQKLGVGQRIWKSLSDSSGKLSALRESLEEDDGDLRSLLDIDQNISTSQRGEKILAQIEQNFALIQKIDANIQLSKLPVAAKAISGAYEDQYKAL